MGFILFVLTWFFENEVRFDTDMWLWSLVSADMIYYLTRYHLAQTRKDRHNLSHFGEMMGWLLPH